MNKVQILLSTYNGEKYLREQLNSIINQDYQQLSILIRDDGSTDNTIQIIQEYTDKDSRINYYHGENIGAIKSFFDLMKKADITADYFAFSDQDDVWIYNKLRCAIEKLSIMNSNIPLLYCGKITLVDENLKKINSTIKDYPIVPDFGNALIENINVGCTSVINRKLLEIVQKHIPEFTIMHDWWLYLSASAFGKVYYDTCSYILYRQHQNNVIGARATYLNEFKHRVANYTKNRGKLMKQLVEFKTNYHVLLKSDIVKCNMLNYLINNRRIEYKLKVLFYNNIYRQRNMDNMIFKFLFLMNQI